MNTCSIPKRFICFIVLFLMGNAPAFALVEAPLVSIQDVSSDAGSASNGGLFTIDATALSITTNISSTLTSTTTISENFSLSATYAGATGTNYNYTNGTLSVGSLLFATFGNLAVVDLGTGKDAMFSADLIYTGGSRKGALTNGRIAGMLANITGNLGGDFTVANTFADVGKIAVVPVPAAMWLFTPMLMGLMGFGFRSQQKRKRQA